MIKIVTDSTCDLPPTWFNRYNITIVPVNIQFGLETYREGVTIDRESFYHRIQTEGVIPTTSQPSVGEFTEIFEALAADGSEVLAIHLTSKLSGTWQTARLAASQLQDKLKVHVVDSMTGSVGLGLLVREAAQMVGAGFSLAEVMSCLETRRSQINIFIMLKDLRYARLSGRVGRLRETLVSLLNVKPIVSVADGLLIPLDRVRGHKKGLERMLALAEERVGDAPIHLGVAHALDPAEAETLLAEAQTRLNCQETFITDLALSLAVHFGPGAVGFATYPAEQPYIGGTTHHNQS
jgi:DegV family protein with EDD domain